MTFLPIVERELREAARRPATHRIRLGAAMIALAIGGFISFTVGYRSPQQVGLVLFSLLAAFLFLYCLLIGAARTSDCLSEEKREGTLGLLFLTDLKGYDIVLGKLAASSLNTCYGMLAVFPIMAIPLMMGGVTLPEFGRVVLAAVNCLFFSLAVGMFFSSVCREERRSAALAVSTVLLISIGLPIVGIFMGATRGSQFADPVFFVPSPGYMAFMAFEETSRNLRSFNFFWLSVTVIHLMGWGLLALAAVIVPGTWQESARPQSEKAIAAVSGDTPAKRFRRRLLDRNPYYWLAARPWSRPFGVWVFLALVALVWAYGLMRWPNDWVDEGAFAATAIVLHSALKLWVASEAVRTVSADRRSGALELLLCTPLAVREVVRGQMLALRRQFAWPTVVVLATDTLFLFLRPGDKDFLIYMLVTMVVLVADLFTLALLGLWEGLRMRGANRAIGSLVARILALPWVILFALLLTVQMTPFRRMIHNVDEEHIFIFGGVLALAINGLFLAPAWRGLLHRFREVAASPQGQR